jgi:glycine betaine/proline transport system ATP-binding protein
MDCRVKPGNDDNFGRNRLRRGKRTGYPDVNEAATKLSCRNVWKLFGHDPGGYVRRLGRMPSHEEAVAAGFVPAVADVSLDIRSGEIFVIMGLSGSGKSTLVRCLSRLVEPTSGHILLDGRDLLTVAERELIELRRHRMGMVFQHFALLPHLSVLRNVAFPLEIQGIAREEREKRAREMIELVGLGGREENLPKELSGGQQQRVGIARSLAVGPELWFLDEPFSALDPLIRREMQNEFLRLQGLLNKTIVFITHDFDEAIRLADRIAIMRDGRVVQVGTAEELIVRPADGYVEEFTREAPRAKILTLRSIMRPLNGTRYLAGEVPAGSRVVEVARRIDAAEGEFAVVDEGGKTIGVIDRATLMEVLLDASGAPARATD